MNDIYILAHEMKNPLCVANGYLEMMNENNLDDYKKIIRNEINNSLEILDEYMEFNQMLINKEEIDLNVLLLDINKDMRDYLKNRKISLKIAYFDDEVYLKADYNKLRQVFYNLIKNSVEAMSKNIYISYELKNNYIQIFIKNDGEKISEKNIDKIGESFSNKIIGHGIGTTLSKKIIEMHSGKIKYINNINNGISVIITLPLN